MTKSWKVKTRAKGFGATPQVKRDFTKTRCCKRYPVWFAGVVDGSGDCKVRLLMS